MTLLPIIYTSLLIFTAILLFVIFVSYVAYKAKSHGKHPPYYKELVIPAPIHINRQPSQKIVRPLPVQIAPPTEMSIRQTRKISQRPIENRNAKRYNQSLSKVYNRSNTRLEIINTSISQQKEYRFNEAGRFNHTRDLSEMNMFNFYSDNTDPSFMRLSATQIHQAV